jgi:hypothetical protein
MERIYTGQLVVSRKDGDVTVSCPKCLSLMSMKSTAWYDNDGLYRHYGCLSLQRRKEIDDVEGRVSLAGRVA